MNEDAFIQQLGPRSNARGLFVGAILVHGPVLFGAAVKGRLNEHLWRGSTHALRSRRPKWHGQHIDFTNGALPQPACS
eukprot:14653174-Alexandrium_andersonii.AAC.1